VDAASHLDGAGQPRVEQQLELGADTVVARAFTRMVVKLYIAPCWR